LPKNWWACLTLGRAKVTITAEETLRFQAQPASWSIAVSSGTLDQAVLTDDYSGARGDIDIVDSVFPAFVASEVLTIPDQAPSGNIYYTSTVTTDGSPLTTFQLDTANLTGNVSVQASSDATPILWTGMMWISLISRQGNTVSNVQFNGSTERLGINVQGFHPYIRLEFGIDAGNVNLIQYR
jgi:hypothetical protein